MHMQRVHRRRPASPRRRGIARGDKARLDRGSVKATREGWGRDVIRCQVDALRWALLGDHEGSLVRHGRKIDRCQVWTVLGYGDAVPDLVERHVGVVGLLEVGSGASYAYA